MLSNNQEQQLRGYLDASTVLSITFPFAYGANQEPCLLIVSEAGNGRYTDVITPSGTTHTVDQQYPLNV